MGKHDDGRCNLFHSFSSNNNDNWFSYEEESLLQDSHMDWY